MQEFARSVLQFLRSEDGPTSVEYAVMAGFIIAVAVTAISAVGTATLGLYTESATKMP
jgi:pilus assembly protein Flp/PilA